MKPVVLPMLHLLCGCQSGNWLCGNVNTFAAADAQHTLVLVRKNLYEIRNRMLPVVENPLAATASCKFYMPSNQLTHLLNIVWLNERFEIDGFQIAPFLS